MHPAAYTAAETDITAADEQPNPLLAKALGPDPWLPYSCPRCGDEDRTGMPERCPCGYQNYGGTK